MRSVNKGGDDPVTGDFSRERWAVPVYGLTSGDPAGIMQAIAHRDGTVTLHLTCEGSRTRVRLDVCMAAQLSTGSWEAAGSAQQLTGHFGNDQSPPPQPPDGSGDLPEAWRSHLHQSAPLGNRSPRRRRRLPPANQSAAMDATRTIGLHIQRIRKARKKSLRVISGLAGMSASTLHRIERGQRELTIFEIATLASALKISPAKLIRWPILAPAHR